MFGLFGVVEALDLRNQTLVFRSTRSYEIGHKTSVRVQIPPGSGRIRSFEVQVEARRTQPAGGGVLYRSKVLNDLQGLEWKGNDPALRGESRVEVGMRVMSKDLPGFKAMTVDLSETGAQLEVDEPMPVGKALVLNLDLESFRVPRVQIPAEVIWCRSNLQGTQHRAGVQFCPPDEASRELLQELADTMSARAHSELRDLLEEAKLLGPDAPVYPQAQPAAAPTPAQPERRGAPRALILPLRARLEGYARNLRAGTLRLVLCAAEGSSQVLEFPDCQVVRDHHCAHEENAFALHSYTESPALEELHGRLGAGNWKHYQLVDESNQILLEILSGQCRPRPSHSPL